jgi:hypothetical protein
MRVTMPSQFVEGAASGAEDALEQIDESSEVHQHIVHEHDGTSRAADPLNDEEKATLAELLRRSKANGHVAAP